MFSSELSLCCRKSEKSNGFETFSSEYGITCSTAVFPAAIVNEYSTTTGRGRGTGVLHAAFATFAGRSRTHSAFADEADQMEPSAENEVSIPAASCASVHA